MSQQFLNEMVCYKILEKYGIKIPRHIFISSDSFAGTHPFEEKEPVVLKAVVDGVWHKSDLGLIDFAAFSNAGIQPAYRAFQQRNPQKENWRGLLICEKVSLAASTLPLEILLSIKDDPSCGPIVTLGFGGIHTELLGSELKNGILSFPTELVTAKQANQKFNDHLLGKILLGKIRQGKAIIKPRMLADLFDSVWAIAANFRVERLALLEINPLAVDQDGNLVVLDAVGEKVKLSSRQTASIKKTAPALLPVEALFDPATFVIAGVSSKKKAFGNLILDNFKESDIPAKNIRVLKPNCSHFEGYSAIPTLDVLQSPVDVLILAIPAPAAIELIRKACILSAARLIYLVSGGIGDSADHDNLKERLQTILSGFPLAQRPRVIGPNSLGIVLSPQKVNTLFIPKAKLPIRFYPAGNIGLIAQSGAFFITRISRNPSLPVRYGFCIGNQLDVSATDILQAMATDPSLDVIGLYLEGPPQGDALALAKIIKKITASKRVIIYRAGRSRAGMQAAAGHTGALASEYGIEKNLLREAGALVCESFSIYENSLSWFSAYPDFNTSHKTDITVMTNAGYESVACADGLGERLTELSANARERLTATLAKFRLSGIVSPANPLDLTPMASDDAYFECARDLLAQKETAALIIGIVPLTAMINTSDEGVMAAHVQRIRKLIDKNNKPIAVVVDAGDIYLKFKQAFSHAGIPLFASVQDVFDMLD